MENISRKRNSIFSIKNESQKGFTKDMPKNIFDKSVEINQSNLNISNDHITRNLNSFYQFNNKDYHNQESILSSVMPQTTRAYRSNKINNLEIIPNKKSHTKIIINNIYRKYFEEYSNPYYTGPKLSQTILRKRSRISFENCNIDKNSSLYIDSKLENSNLIVENRIEQKDKFFLLLQHIFEYQKIEDPNIVQIYKNITPEFYQLIFRKFEIKQQNHILIFNLKKLKKRNEEMNKLVIKKAMKSMMNFDKKQQLKQQHTNNILGE